MPTATISPAMPGRVSVKLAVLESSSTMAYVVRAGDEQRADHHDAEAAVVEQAVEHHQQQPDDAGGDARGELVAGQRGADGLDAEVGEGDRQRAVLEAGGEALGRGLGEVAADLGLAVGDQRVHGRRGDDLAVEHDRELAARRYWSLGQTSACGDLAEASVPSPLKSMVTTVVDPEFCGIRPRPSRARCPRSWAAESRYFVCRSGPLAGDQRLLRVVLDVDRLPSCGQVKAL